MAKQPPFQQFGPNPGPMPGRAPGAPRQTEKRLQTMTEARRLIGEDKLDEAFKLLEPMSIGFKQDPEAIFLLGIIAEKQRNIPRAIEYAKQSLRIFQHADAHFLLARLHRIAGNTDDSIDACQKILDKLPDNEASKIIMGGAMEEGGRFDDARAVVEPIVESYHAKGEQAPPPVRFEWAKLCVHAKEYDTAIDEVDGLMAAEPDEQLQRVALHVKAKACDRSKQYAKAVEAAGAANRIGELEFSPELYEEQVSALMEIWSAEAMTKFPLAKCDSELPVFVAGMPRSGTSLIDQIIDAHPKASGVGELASIETFAKQLSLAYDSEKEPPECFGSFNEGAWTKAANAYVRDLVKRAPNGAERVVNKALGNNKLVGLIARLFPKTRIIHAIRDPRDVAVSCFMGGFNHAVHPWTTRFEWIFPAWEQSRRMMDHWKATLDVPILEVQYEELVRDPGTQFPRIIDFLGLEWDDACNEYYKSKRTVRTLSYDQVNRPIYTTSAGRHANYLEFMGEVAIPSYPA